MRDDRLYLIHITECIGRIEEYVRGGRDAFMASTLVQDAVLRNLQTLAESSQRLSDDLKARHPDIEWRRIAGLVWKIVENDLPPLKERISALLKA